MARQGISKMQVKTARDTLSAQGLPITIDSIRLALGQTGSKTTISRHLQALAQEAPVGPVRQQTLSEPLSQLVGQLAEQLQQEAALTIEALRAQQDSARRQTGWRAGSMRMSSAN